MKCEGSVALAVHCAGTWTGVLIVGGLALAVANW